VVAMFLPALRDLDRDQTDERDVATGK